MLEDDKKMIQMALQKGMIRPEHVQQGMAGQKEYEKQGYSVPLSHVLMKLGYLKQSEWGVLKKEMDVAPTLAGIPPVETLAEEAQEGTCSRPDSVGLSFFASPGEEISTQEMQSTKKRPANDFSSKDRCSALTVDMEDPQETAAQSLSGKGERGMLEHEAKHPLTFGRYEILDELGHGNMGRVFLVRDPQLDRFVALKVLLAGEMADATATSRFVREAQSTAKLDHPNIIKVYDIGQEAGTRYFTMDYVKGKPLDVLLKESKRLSPRKAANIMRKVCEAIDYAHKQNIIHRDIKPGNVMMTEGEEPKVMDFGLARAIREGAKLSRTGSIMGTPAYMPPEQAQGKTKEIDERSDVYSLGATLYELVTGQIPFPGKDVVSILMKVVSAPPTPPHLINSMVPLDIENICLKAMEKKKENRYRSAGEMARDLGHFLDGEAISVVRSSFSAKAWIKQHKTSLATASAFLALMLVCTVMLFFAWRDAEKAEKIAQMEKEKAEKAKEEALESARKENEARKLAEQEQEKARKANESLKASISLSNWQLSIQNNILPMEICNISKLEKEFRNISANLPGNSECELVAGKAYLLLLKNITSSQERLHIIKMALNQFKKASKKHPYAAILGYQTSSLLLENNDIESQKEDFFNLIDNDIQNSYSRFKEAIVLQKQNKLQESLDLLTKITAENNHFFDAYIEKGVICRKLKKYKEAETFFLRALQINPNSVLINIELATLYLDIDSEDKNILEFYFKRSLEFFEFALEKDPCFARLYSGKARLYRKWANLSSHSKHYSRLAIQNINKAFEFEISNPLQYYSWQKELYLSLEENEKALEIYNILLSKNPDNSELLAGRASLYMKMGNYQNSVKDYENAIQFSKNSGKILLYQIHLKNLKKYLDSNKK